MNEFIQLEDAEELRGRIFTKVCGIDNIFRLQQIDKFIDNITR